VFVDGDVSMEKYQDEASGKTLSAIRIVQSTHPLRSFLRSIGIICGWC